MSQPKRKTKKSLNSSISDISNSERLPDSIFNNYALAEVKNVHVSDVLRSCRKENKTYNYTGIAKVVEEKNIVIETQERQI